MTFLFKVMNLQICVDCVDLIYNNDVMGHFHLDIFIDILF